MPSWLPPLSAHTPDTGLTTESQPESFASGSSVNEQWPTSMSKRRTTGRTAGRFDRATAVRTRHRNRCPRGSRQPAAGTGGSPAGRTPHRPAVRDAPRDLAAGPWQTARPAGDPPGVPRPTAVSGARPLASGGRSLVAGACSCAAPPRPAPSPATGSRRRAPVASTLPEAVSRSDIVFSSASYWRCVLVATTVTVVALGITGCGGDSSSPTAPTEITSADATIVSVEVSGTTTLTTIGEAAQLSLVATFSDGSTQVIEPALVEWRSSDPTVATVTDGLVTAVRGGQAEITAAYDTHTADLIISVQVSTHSRGPSGCCMSRRPTGSFAPSTAGALRGRSPMSSRGTAGNLRDSRSRFTASHQNGASSPETMITMAGATLGRRSCEMCSPAHRCAATLHASRGRYTSMWLKLVTSLTNSEQETWALPWCRVGIWRVWRTLLENTTTVTTDRTMGLLAAGLAD